MRYKTILLVDDEELIRTAAALWLRSVSDEITVLEAGSPDEAKALLTQHPVDLVFLDLRFGRDREVGLSILRWIKDSDNFDHIPVNIMSGEILNRAEIQKLLAAGAAGFISKTSTTKQLFSLALQNIEAGCVFIQAADIDFDESGHAPPEKTKMTPESLGIRPSHYKVLVRHARGMPYKRIASQCKISEQHVRETVGELCRIFKAENSKALIYQLAISGIALDEGFEQV